LNGETILNLFFRRHIYWDCNFCLMELLCWMVTSIFVMGKSFIHETKKMVKNLSPRFIAIWPQHLHLFCPRNGPFGLAPHYSPPDQKSGESGHLTGIMWHMWKIVEARCCHRSSDSERVAHHLWSAEVASVRGGWEDWPWLAKWFFMTSGPQLGHDSMDW
jgi:hypothetical protein